MASPLKCKADVLRHENMAIAFTVLAAARDLGDLPCALIARRVIEDYFAGKHPREADLRIVVGYFR
jgi:hypothetical protein